MHLGRCCHCADTPLNCFGCNAAQEPPSTWQLDLPAAPAYAHQTTGSCAADVDNVSLFPLFPQLHQREVMSVNYEHPTLADTYTLLQDTAASAAECEPNDVCVWSAGTLTAYEDLQVSIVPDGNTSFCPSFIPTSIVNQSQTITDVWDYNQSAPITNCRVREPVQNSLLPPDLACTAANLCDQYGVSECQYRLFGERFFLLVEDSHLVVRWTWVPRYKITFLQYDKGFGGNPWRNFDGYASHFDNPLIIPLIFGVDECRMPLHPSADNPSTVGSGVLAEYKKLINCATDFDGTPVVLPLHTATVNPGQTQSIASAMGITLPSFLSITPIP